VSGDPCQQLVNRRVRHFSLEHLLYEIGQRLTTGFRAAHQLAVQPIGDVADLDHPRHAVSVAHAQRMRKSLGRSTRHDRLGYGTMPSMCCVLVLLAFLGPRVVLALLWILTNYLNRAFDTFLWPLLGFLFLPWTTIAFAVAQNELGGASGLGLIVVALGFLADIGVIGGGARRRL